MNENKEEIPTTTEGTERALEEELEKETEEAEKPSENHHQQ